MNTLQDSTVLLGSPVFFHAPGQSGTAQEALWDRRASAGNPERKPRNRTPSVNSPVSFTRRLRERFRAVASQLHELVAARGQCRRLREQEAPMRREPPAVGALVFMPISRTGAGMLFDVFSQREVRASALVASGARHRADRVSVDGECSRSRLTKGTGSLATRAGNLLAAAECLA